MKQIDTDHGTTVISWKRSEERSLEETSEERSSIHNLNNNNKYINKNKNRSNYKDNKGKSVLKISVREEEGEGGEGEGGEGGERGRQIVEKHTSVVKRFSDGRVYVGEVVDDAMQGRGVLTWPKGMDDG